ncbi:MAG: AAA family ATPase [Planctomycetota bacterium]|nr:AAA family ATPase [Planctomycetota bacterium]
MPSDLYPNEVSPNGSDRPPLLGYRLAKLEVYNWGTFDGAVYSVQPRGQTTLLVGENGSGKSTLVDALLTLLVRPQTRNYNVAAGASRNERDEKTYIRGAYDRTVGDGGRPQIQYLRNGNGHYTALLASFSNAAAGSMFTICQVLYLNNENAVEKVYAYCDSERSIVRDLGELGTGSSIARTLKDRGFKTTSSYKEYFQWLQRKTGFLAKAMDIFNQTVAVKDVQRLDEFIRQHMLERKPWNERVGRLLTHFAELSEAHRMLVRVRQQDELLRPIVEAGQRYQSRLEELELSKLRLSAIRFFFADRTTQLLEPMCSQWQQQIQNLNEDILRLEKLQDRLRSDIARLEFEIENAGGDRLRQLPGLIEQAEAIAKVKATYRARFESQLVSAGISVQVTSPEQFAKVRKESHARRTRLLEERQQKRTQESSLQFEIGSLTRQLFEDRSEAEALEKRKGNLPESFIAVRDAICRDLKLAPSDLPFAAELIAVNPKEREWESSVEQVLHSFARSLLVSPDFYARVAGYVDRTRLVDGRGQGQRLVYLRVGSKAKSGLSTPTSQASSSQSRLMHKLEFPDHPLVPWVRSEIQSRFDYVACETIEEFQKLDSAAMTKNRHIKSGNARHEKDDRQMPDDRRHFVLGWDNRQKRLSLAEAIRRGTEDLQQLQTRLQKLNAETDRITGAIEALDQALRTEDFDAIDNSRHEFEASQLKLERQRIEESDDRIRELKAQCSDRRAEAVGHQQDRDQAIAQRTMREREWNDGNRLLESARTTLRQADTEGTLILATEQFDSLQDALKEPLSIQNLGTLPSETERLQRESVDRLQERLVPIAREMTSGMTRFLKKFPDEQIELDADVGSLSSFVALFERISVDDLPKHEERFKRRLNENVLNEIGLLHGGLEDERDEIRDKIEQLNMALKLLEWKSGTFMRLEPTDVQDREIQDFRRDLAGCLTGTLDGSPEANEATFVRIEKFVAKLRDDGNTRWREKVVDVRNWFNFAAREIVKETGEPRSYYDGGTGQSGGEKGKLAFLVLVAAIAYQYDLDPDATTSERFQFVMVDEMFSRSDDAHAEYALDLFARFGLQLLIVAPLDAKARVTEPYVGTYLHVVKNKQTNRSELISITADQLNDFVDS